MTIRLINPHDVHAPAGAYSHGVSTSGAGRMLYISGQLGIDKDGNLGQGFAEQARQCWSNIVAVLAADGMTTQNLVKVTTFVTDTSCAAELGHIPAPFLNGTAPASTLIAVARLMQPEWLIEVEAIGVKAEIKSVCRNQPTEDNARLSAALGSFSARSASTR